MLDVRRAYQWQRTPSHKEMPSALVQLHDGRLLEFLVQDKWLEGRRWRYNLVRFRDGVIQHALSGYNGDYVEEFTPALA